MPFLADVAGRRAAVELAAAHPEATATDLAVALVGHVASAARPHAGPTDPVLVLDGREVPGSTPLASLGLCPGAEVLVRSRDAAPPPPGGAASRHDPAVAELRVVGGLHAGARVALAPGRHVLGRAAPSVLTVDDPAMSAVHAELRVEAGRVDIADAGSTNGTWLDGTAAPGASTLGPGAVARLGATEVTVGADPAVDAVPLPFNRPPRRLDPSPHRTLNPPTAPAPASPPLPVGVVAALAPAVVGIVMVLVLHSLVWGVLALLGPVTVVGGSWEQRRRVGRRRAREVQQFRRRVAELAAALAAASEVEVARLQRLLPDPAEAIRRIAAPSRHLWERRPAHPDWLALRAGTGPVGWTPPVAGDPGSWAPEVAAAVDAASRLSHTPVALELARGGVAGIAGPRDAALAVARSLVLQAAAAHGPADLLLGVVADDDRAGAWDWCSWLPHALGDTGTRPLVDPAEVVVPRGVTLLLVVDVAAGLGRDAPARPLLQRDDGSVAGIVLADRADRLPSCCTTVIELTDGHGGGRVTSTRGGVETPELLAAGVPESDRRDRSPRLGPARGSRGCRRSGRAPPRGPPARPRRSRPVHRQPGRRPDRGRARRVRGRGRPRPRRPPRPRGRHHRLGQERAAAHARRRAGPRGATSAAHLPARRLQGRQRLRPPRRAPPHRRRRQRPRPRARRAGPALPRGRAALARAAAPHHGRRRRGRAPSPRPRRGATRAAPGGGRRRVRHARQRRARRPRRARRRGAARTQPRGEPGPRHAASGWRRQRQHPRQRGAPHRAAPPRRGGLGRRDRRARRRRTCRGRSPVAPCCAAGPTAPDVAQVAHISRAAPPPDDRRVTLVPFGCGPAPRPPSAGPAAARSGPTDLDSIVEACQAAFAASGAPPPRPGVDAAAPRRPPAFHPRPARRRGGGRAAGRSRRADPARPGVAAHGRTPAAGGRRRQWPHHHARHPRPAGDRGSRGPAHPPLRARRRRQRAAGARRAGRGRRRGRSGRPRPAATPGPPPRRRAARPSRQPRRRAPCHRAPGRRPRVAAPRLGRPARRRARPPR